MDSAGSNHRQVDRCNGRQARRRSPARNSSRVAVPIDPAVVGSPVPPGAVMLCDSAIARRSDCLQPRRWHCWVRRELDPRWASAARPDCRTQPAPVRPAHDWERVLELLSDRGPAEVLEPMSERKPAQAPAVMLGLRPPPRFRRLSRRHLYRRPLPGQRRYAWTERDQSQQDRKWSYEKSHSTLVFHLR